MDQGLPFRVSWKHAGPSGTGFGGMAPPSFLFLRERYAWDRRPGVGGARTSLRCVGRLTYTRETDGGPVAQVVRAYA